MLQFSKRLDLHIIHKLIEKLQREKISNSNYFVTCALNYQSKS
mgnify:CR=1 FL=1